MNLHLRLVYGFCFAASMAMIAVGLQHWGAAEIRAEPTEMYFLTFVGGCCLFIAGKFFSWMGVSFRDDVTEQGNVAALIALCGAVLGVGLIYMGGSIGEGPSYSNNVFSAGLALGTWIALWLILEMGGRVSRSITEDRDVASGIRLGSFLLANGLVLGRAVAGDWHSEAATVHDFIHEGWAAVLLLLVALPMERSLRPSRLRPFPAWRSHGLSAGLFYLLYAGVCLWRLGAWEGKP